MSDPINNTENTETILNNGVPDNDVHLKLQHLTAKISELEIENKNIQDNFNAQRAKLHKLYIQKEEELTNVTSEHVQLQTEVERLTKELDEAKSQLVIAGIVKENAIEAEKQRAQEEIASLNLIVQDSVEVSSTSQSEVKKLKQVIHLLESQVNKLKGEKEKEGLLLAPSNMLSGAKTLARKVVGQLGSDSDYHLQDNLEDSMKRAQEHTEVLKSLVIPLENKIQELTVKLQEAEEKLRKYESGIISPPENKLSALFENEPSRDLSVDSTTQSSQILGVVDTTDQQNSFVKPERHREKVSPLPISKKSMICEMCTKYEAQLLTNHKLSEELKKEKAKIKTNFDKLKEDFAKETEFRKKMEDKWNEKKEEHKNKVAELKSQYETADNEVKILRQTFAQLKSDVENHMKKLSFDREKISLQLEEIQRENDKLMGKHSKHSSQLREESINFPDNVADLQVLLLQTHEELINAKIAKEAKEEQETNLKCEIQLLQEQLNTEMSDRNAKESELSLRNSELSKLLALKEKESLKLKNIAEKLTLADREQKEQIQSLKVQFAELMKENKRHEDNVSKLQTRVGSLQQQLDTSEAVQKDFVRLSQSLQIELEKIRRADTEVRWQHEDDIDDCGGCKTSFLSGRKKDHCRHCGQIFCPTCLSHTVVSGPRKRQSRVCQVCHTLLNRETAPYFSQEPPHTPD